MDKTTSEMHPLIERFGDSGVILACLIVAVGLTFGVVALARYTLDWLGFIP